MRLELFSAETDEFWTLMINWYCIYTKTKKEDVICRKLAAFSDIELFNPKLKRNKRIGSRYLEVTEELFPSYIFSRLDLNRYCHMITYTRGVRRFVGDHLGRPYVVDEAIIEFIRSKMKDGFIHPEKHKLRQGEKVLIKEGLFSGFNGIFLSEVKASERVMILLSAIQYQARVEVPRDFIVRADGASGSTLVPMDFSV